MVNPRKQDDTEKISRLVSDADKLINISYKITNEPRVLLKAFEMLSRALSLNQKRNKVKLTKIERNILKETLKLADIHKKSRFEFSKSSKMVIFGDNTEVYTIDYSKLVQILALSKKLLDNTHI